MSPIILVLILILGNGCKNHALVELQNDTIGLELDTNNDGVPFIRKAYEIKSDKVIFINHGAVIDIEHWLPGNLVASDFKMENSGQNIWQSENTPLFHKAVASLNYNDLQIQWIVELSKSGALFQTYVQLSNKGNDNIPIERFPIWYGNLAFSQQDQIQINYWQALSYEPLTKSLIPDDSLILHSMGYSSDNHLSNGQIPYWELKNEVHSLFFSLTWCGGWRTELKNTKNELELDTHLPPEETQLILLPGDTIKGPLLQVLPTWQANVTNRRRDWLSQRQQLADNLYKKPDRWYPFIYNHWYSVRFNLSGQFIRNQVAAILPYDFDVFVVDAGWYNKVGDWTPNTQKFRPGEFESALRYVRDNNINVGIWSCPWLLEVENDTFPPEIDEPRFYRKFMDAYALDLADYNFSQRLYEHISSLKSQFNMSWWKYDQELFGEKSRKGKMKNVIALQNALIKVRNSFPELYIENCMSGGRMINEFTDQVAQIHWIRDGGNNGLKHARSNIKEALGAVQFLSPDKVQRWTNRPDELEENNIELLKYYCRSAMIGVWGVSADMSKISDSKKNIILQELSIYRKLNEFKSSLRYEILYPSAESDIAGIIFYTQHRNDSAIILFRWDKTGTIEKNLSLDLPGNAKYKITNIDTKESLVFDGNELRTGKSKFIIPTGKMSVVYFIESI